MLVWRRYLLIHTHRIIILREQRLTEHHLLL
jgi:hypothetical protein